jgi:pyruvate dehydrogenase E2 component (dihydrolipoamide acetyltransferase)
MSTVYTLPRLGETMDEGRVAKWLKQPGDSFRRGETIAEIESDKTIVELPALEDGVLEEILAPEDTTLAVGEPLYRFRSA